MLDIRQSAEYTSYLKLQGWLVEKISKTNYFIRRFPLLGSVLKIQRPEIVNIVSINKLCRKYNVFQVIVEPKDDKQTELLVKYGYKLSQSPFLPSKTLQIDLTQPIDKIFESFKKDTRQAIKRSDYLFNTSCNNGGEKIKICEYSTPEDIKIFRKNWKKSVNYDRYVPSADQLIKLKQSFPKQKSLFLASHNIFSRIIGGVIFTTSSHDNLKEVVYYWHGFTNNEGRSTLSQYSLLYYGILWAKKQGYKIFDFEGIYDSRFPNKSWLGFTHFKKSFGGTEVLYPGCYTKFRFPL